jgi:hypothetical protein
MKIEKGCVAGYLNLKEGALLPCMQTLLSEFAIIFKEICSSLAAVATLECVHVPCRQAAWGPCA